MGVSPAMRALRRSVAAVGPLDSTVLVTGETGVGKGVVARALHASSKRRHAPFVHADCASLAPSVIESELFGHERGAFTGAVGRHAGRLERAAGGTLFLDEIGELDLHLQARLLRALQDREFERVGGSGPLRLTARVAAATNRDLSHEIRAGRFRADLYFRLAVVHLEVPPLRRRLEDLPALVRVGLVGIERRLRRHAPRLSETAMARLLEHPWPGNVRELWNALERLSIRCGDRVAGAGDVAAVLGPRFEIPCGDTRFLCDAEADEPARIAAALRESGGNVAGAARRLGLPRTTLRRRIRRYGLRGPGSAQAEHGRALPGQQAQRHEREGDLVEAHERGLGYAPEDATAEPGSDDHRSTQQCQG